MSKINKTPIETRLAIERRSAAMLPDRPTQAGFKPWDIRRALFTAIIADKGACLMGEIDRIVDETNAAIDALKEKITTAGTITIPVSEWEDGSPTIALFTLDGFGKGMSALLMPADINTQTAAREARLRAFPDVSQIDDDTQTVEIIRANADKAPGIQLRFAYLILKTDASVAPSVAIIGVDAYGETEEPTSVDLSGFSPNENGKGSIVETYADRTVVTELTYDDTGRIIKIGDTTLEWGEEE